MTVEKIQNELVFTPQIPNEHIRVEVISDLGKILIEDKIITSEFRLRLNYIGKYLIYSSNTSTFSDEPSTVIYNMDQAIENVICEFISIFCDCDDCKKGFEPCGRDNSSEVLCLYNKINSLSYLFPENFEEVENFLQAYFKEFYLQDFIKSIHKHIYYGKESCCEQEALIFMVAKLYSLYYVYLRTGEDKEYIKELFDIENLDRCITKLGICLDTLKGLLDNEFGPVLLPPVLTSFSFMIEPEINVEYTLPFTIYNFTNHFNDPQGSLPEEIIIQTLPGRGSLYLNGVLIGSQPTRMPVSVLGDLTYRVTVRTPSRGGINNGLGGSLGVGLGTGSVGRPLGGGLSGGLGSVVVPEAPFDSFTIKISNEYGLFSNLATVTIRSKAVEPAVVITPVAVDDEFSTDPGSEVIFNVKANDDEKGLTTNVVITQGPTNGTASVVNGAIKYKHNNSNTTRDTIKYKLKAGAVESNIATVGIDILTKCSNLISEGLSGNGVFEIDIFLGEQVGTIYVDTQSYGIPDRFQIIYDGEIVADSLYYGEDVDDYEAQLLGSHSLPVHKYVNGNFVPTGQNQTEVVGTQHIDQNPNGTKLLQFIKHSVVDKMTIRIISILPNTGFNFTSSCPDKGYLISYGSKEFGEPYDEKTITNFNTSLFTELKVYEFLADKEDNFIVLPNNLVITKAVTSDGQNILEILSEEPFTYTRQGEIINGKIYKLETSIPLNETIIFKLHEQ